MIPRKNKDFHVRYLSRKDLSRRPTGGMEHTKMEEQTRGLVLGSEPGSKLSFQESR